MRLPQREVWLWLKESTCSDEYVKWLPRQTITHFKCTYALNIVTKPPRKMIEV